MMNIVKPFRRAAPETIESGIAEIVSKAPRTYYDPEIRSLVVDGKPLAELPVATDLDDAARERELGMAPAPAVTYEPIAEIPLPEYVTHSDDTTLTGRMCGEAIVKEYEAAAKEIEQLGVELKAAQLRAAERSAVLEKAFAELTTLAATYRSEAKRVFDEIEACAAKAESVIEMCDAMRNKIRTGE
jgi:hypothetical protein